MNNQNTQLSTWYTTNKPSPEAKAMQRWANRQCKDLDALTWNKSNRGVAIDKVVEAINSRTLTYHGGILGGGANGTVVQLKYNTGKGANLNKYALKIVPLTNKMTKIEFMNEVRNGSTTDVKKWGVRIYCFAFEGKWGVFVMDNVTKGVGGMEKVMTFESYEEQGGSINAFKVAFNKTLSAMLRYPTLHGDLHANNVLIVFNNNRTIKKVVIIDYGRMIRDFTPGVIRNNMSLTQKLTVVNRIFFNNQKKPRTALVKNYMKRNIVVCSTPRTGRHSKHGGKFAEKCQVWNANINTNNGYFRIPVMPNKNFAKSWGMVW